MFGINWDLALVDAVVEVGRKTLIALAGNNNLAVHLVGVGARFGQVGNLIRRLGKLKAVKQPVRAVLAGHVGQLRLTQRFGVHHVLPLIFPRQRHDLHFAVDVDGDFVHQERHGGDFGR